MAWRFKASKYKNATPIVPKPEACVRDIAVGSYQTYGNNIAASAAFMAFIVDHNGTSLAVLPIDDCGRKSKTMPLIHAHSDTITDMDFSPFHDGLLATSSVDGLVKIWIVPENGVEESITKPECQFYHRQRRVETLRFHPTADSLLSTTSFTTVSLWDIVSEKELVMNQKHFDVIQSISWKYDGTLLATSSKDKQVRIMDVRMDPNVSPFTHVANSHQSIKDSRIVWLGDQPKILTTGFNSSRQREVHIRDLRRFEEPEKTLVLDSSTGILIPLYDPDTAMLFLAGKGDTTISYLEVVDREPFLIEGIRHNGDQTKGACLVPKRSLNVMQGEVNRVLQLSSTAVIPIMYQVPRKSYREFHADLFPETKGCEPQLSGPMWLTGSDLQVPLISLDPTKHQSGIQVKPVHRGSLETMRANLAAKPYKMPQKSYLSNKNKICKPSIKAKVEVKVDLKVEEKKQAKEIHNEKGKHIQNGDKSNDNKTENGKAEVENGGSVMPPKPMPRRTNSVSESEDTAVTKPVARPRTCSVTQPAIALTTVTVSTAMIAPPCVTSVNPSAITGGYKPRLGPKPFSAPKLSGVWADNDQNKPSVDDKPSLGMYELPVSGGPRSLNGSSQGDMESMGNGSYDSEGLSLGPETTDFPPEQGSLDNVDNGDSVSETDLLESPEAPKTPTTAERRKLFEYLNSTPETERRKSLEKGGMSPTQECKNLLGNLNLSPTHERKKTFESPVENVKQEDDDKLEDFDRSSHQRSSIADRRRLYESRSASVQEEKKPIVSPTPMRRKDSLKKSPVKEQNKGDSPSKPVPMQRQHSLEQPKSDGLTVAPIPKRTSTVFGRVSKFRHLKGTPLHKSAHIENIRNVSRQISGECDGFHGNAHRVAVPLEGAGGKIAIFELSKTGKLPDGVIPTLVHGTNVMDFTWDPFNDWRLAVGGDDGIIRLWVLPPGGLVEPTNTPTVELSGGHLEKIYCLKFHPLARDILASASYDMTVRIWDLAAGRDIIMLQGHVDQIFSIAWSPDGAALATVSRDSKIRIYEPRSSTQPTMMGNGPVGSRGARIVWALGGSCIVVLGFDKASERQIQVFNARDLSAPLNTIGLDVSPAILIPFYDEDSSTLFATGKGDSTIYAFEVTEESPYLCALSHHRCNTLHQGLSFLPKKVCDVSAVEFARGLRLTNNVIEPLSFTVPRIKTGLFQDDIFPPTQVTWEPTMNSVQWLSGENKQPRFISLQPEGMESLSSTQGSSAEKPSPPKPGAAGSFAGAQQPFNRLGWNSDMSGASKEKQEQIQRSVSNRMEVNLRLEQDDMEGVDEIEWDD